MKKLIVLCGLLFATNAWSASTDRYGSLNIAPYDATGTAFGTVANPFNVTGIATSTNTNIEGPVAVGTAAIKSALIGCVYNSTAPAPTSGQQMAIQCDAALALGITRST